MRGWLFAFSGLIFASTPGVEELHRAARSGDLKRVEALIDAEHPDNPILSLLDELPPAQREAVRAHVLEERPYAEIASDWRVDEPTLRQRVSRGLARLRATINQEAL